MILIGPEVFLLIPDLHLLASCTDGAAPFTMRLFICAPVALTPAALCAASRRAAAPATYPADWDVPSCRPYCRHSAITQERSTPLLLSLQTSSGFPVACEACCCVSDVSTGAGCLLMPAILKVECSSRVGANAHANLTGELKIRGYDYGRMAMLQMLLA